MVYHLRRAAIAAACLASIVFILWFIPRVIKPTQPDAEERKRDEQWVNSSPYWIDRQACRWLGLCGIQHIKWDAPALPGNGTGRDGDLKLELLKLLSMGPNHDSNYVELSDMRSWETAPMKKDLKTRRRNAGRSGDAKVLDEIPDYVVAHAPLVHLYSEEFFWPSDIAEHVVHMQPFKDDAPINSSKAVDLDTLARLNAENNTVFLSSKDNVETRPEWLHSFHGIPTPFDGDDDDGDDNDNGDAAPKRPTDGTTWWDADKEHPPKRISDPRRFNGRQRQSHQKRQFREAQRPMVGPVEEKLDSLRGDKAARGGHSDGPAILVLVDKGAGIVDAFWFFFYSYNLGQTVLNVRFGNHVGDWEHCMVRFEHGIPRAMFLSEHAGGQAYAWQALEKRAQKGGRPDRPVIYSAVGSHAMYASSGMHPYVLPFKMLKDLTDQGPLWDPTLNNYAYWYDYEVDRDEEHRPPGEDRTSLVPAASNPHLPTSWFHFGGYWGDDTYPLSDKRQWRLFGEYHYTTGPLGPKFKNLDRKKVCQNEKCRILYSIEAGKKSTWYS
ncbi:hypothetical protein B0T17DRAFT_487416 [Bombardia bombarda]|uniref:Uncharacterized protein n=1 Tax=Bombardia bombarda TaxID=252184 RepID=A0AA39X8U9_9PEZI|nr:hypothetical protein B0T17DRAFT_487416 [Bombardia bombarda]